MDKRKKYKERLLQIDQDLFELKPLLIDNKTLKAVSYTHLIKII